MWNRFPSKSTSLPKIFSVVLLCGGDFRLQIPIRSGTHGHVSTSSYELLSDPWVNKLQFTNLQNLQFFFFFYNFFFFFTIYNFFLHAGQGKRSSFTDVQIWDEPWGFQTPPYDDTKGITDMKKGKNRGKELTNWCE